MYIEITKADDDSGKNVVKIIHDDPSPETRADLVFTTAQVIVVEVAQGAEAMLARTRTNGTRITGDQRGDAWLASRGSDKFDNVKRVETF